MLDDYKYSVGRLVVYDHSEPKLPRQSYGVYGHVKTVGEIIAVDMDPNPKPHWMYTIKNIRNQEITRVHEEQIKYATSVVKSQRKLLRRPEDKRVESAELAEMIARALAVPGKDSMLRTTLREMLRSEDTAAKAARDGKLLPIGEGDYIRVRGDLRKEIEPISNHYAKILSSEESDIAGIENSDIGVGKPSIFRTLRKYKVLTSEKIEAEIYDVEVKVYYTANHRKTVLNWRAASFLSETFNDIPPYNIEYDYLSDHIFTRDELKSKKRSELKNLLATTLYTKGKMSLRDYQRRNYLFVGAPKHHIVDYLLEVSRFDSKKNRSMTLEEIRSNKTESYKLRRFLKS